MAAEQGRWTRAGNAMLQSFGFDLETAPVELRNRVWTYYLPVYGWVCAQLEQHRAFENSSPLMVGISAVQGCGKTTLCEALQVALEAESLTVASLSIDDFYLPNDQLTTVSKSHHDNPLLQVRGNALTHDLELGAATLQNLAVAQADSPPVLLPRYDKSAHRGRGDRAPEHTWPRLTGPVDVVLLEGWMLGFRSLPQDADTLARIDAVSPHLRPINAALARYRDAWDAWMHAWLVIQVDEPGRAAAWRLEAERQRRAAGKPAMTDAEVADFVDRYMPAYHLYLPGLYVHGPTTAREGHTLVVRVDARRQPISTLPSLPPT